MLAALARGPGGGDGDDQGGRGGAHRSGAAFSAGADLAGFAQMAAEGDQASGPASTGLEGPRALANFPKPPDRGHLRSAVGGGSP